MKLNALFVMAGTSIILSSLTAFAANPVSISSINCADSKFDVTKNDPVFLDAELSNNQLNFEVGNWEKNETRPYRDVRLNGVFQTTASSEQAIILSGNFGSALRLSPTAKSGFYNGSYDGYIDVKLTQETPTSNATYDMQRVSNYPLDCVVK